MLNWIHNELKRRFNFEQTKFRWRWMYWSLLVLQKCGCPKIDKNISENCVFYVPWFDCLDSRISRDYRHQCHPSMLGSEKRNYLKGNTRTEIFSFNFRWQKLFWMTATKAATVLVNLVFIIHYCIILVSYLMQVHFGWNIQCTHEWLQQLCELFVTATKLAYVHCAKAQNCMQFS